PGSPITTRARRRGSVREPAPTRSSSRSIRATRSTDRLLLPIRRLNKKAMFASGSPRPSSEPGAGIGRKSQEYTLRMAVVEVAERHQRLVDELLASVEAYRPEANRDLLQRAF